MHANGFEIWQSVVDGYKEPTIPPTNDNRKKLSLNHSKSTNSLLNGLYDLIYTKFIHFSSAKDIWDKLQNIYEGDSKFKAAKLQTYKGQFK